MGGVVGILSLDGGPVDRDLLDRMTQSMTFRGPDGQQVWMSGPVGFGHTLLKTHSANGPERQPLTLDGEVWIVADARVDGRRDLIAALAARGEQPAAGATDAELLLHAYRTWGDDCVDYLLGDFAFAVWDSPHQRLFCARDHFGIKPFYYARLKHGLTFSNTLDCLRLHPGVSASLNEVALGDFLVSDLNQNPATTVFADIECLPPAHVMTCAQGDVRVRRYWTVPVEGPLRYRHPREYVDRFRELLREAVNDRLGTNHLAVYMSGGLDSTAAAAAARELLADQYPAFDLRAHTVVYDRLIPDEERHYSGLAAAKIGIPVSYLSADDYALFDRWDDPALRRPEPDNRPLHALDVDQMRRIAGHSRVAFYCEGPDNLLHYEWRPYAAQLVRDRRFGRLAADVGRHLAAHRRIPFLTRLTNRLKRRPGAAAVATFPEWLNPDFIHRANLTDRWRRWKEGPRSDHPIRPRACASLQLANWRGIFESHDPGSTGLPVEVRHPFMDVRMVRYLLAVPPLPWCEGKHLMREAMRGVLPEPVRRRPKTGLAGDPLSEHIKRDPGWWRTQPSFVPGMAEYVDEGTFRQNLLGGPKDVWTNWINLRPFALNWWLRDQRQRRTGR